MFAIYLEFLFFIRCSRRRLYIPYVEHAHSTSLIKLDYDERHGKRLRKKGTFQVQAYTILYDD